MIKDISYDIIKCDYEDGHCDYMIQVNYKSKGLLFGWNEHSFILEKDGNIYAVFDTDNINVHPWEFVDDYESFDRAYDRQGTRNAFSYRFIKTNTIELAQEIIEAFKVHCEQSEIKRKSKTITKITKV